MNLPKYNLNDQLIAKSDDDDELYVGAVNRITAKTEKENYTYYYEIDGNTFSEQEIVAYNTKNQWHVKNETPSSENAEATNRYLDAKDLF